MNHGDGNIILQEGFLKTILAQTEKLVRIYRKIDGAKYREILEENVFALSYYYM